MDKDELGDLIEALGEYERAELKRWTKDGNGIELLIDGEWREAIRFKK